MKKYFLTFAALLITSNAICQFDNLNPILRKTSEVYNRGSGFVWLINKSWEGIFDVNPDKYYFFGDTQRNPEEYIGYSMGKIKGDTMASDIYIRIDKNTDIDVSVDLSNTVAEIAVFRLHGGDVFEVYYKKAICQRIKSENNEYLEKVMLDDNNWIVFKDRMYIAAFKGFNLPGYFKINEYLFSEK